MKKTVKILSLILLLILVASQLSFAKGLEIVNVSPEDGEKGKQISNMAIKVTFSENMIDESAIEKNKSKFKITDAEGKEQLFQIVYSEEKYPDQLWLILEGELVSNTDYKFEIQPGIISKAGNTLETGMTTSFKTRNTKTDSTISMFMMFGMMGVMFFASSKAAKKNAEENGNVSLNPAQANPYKMAKEKGISVEEAKAIIAKEKAKNAAKLQKYEENKKQKEEAMAAEVEAIQKKLEEEYEAARHARNYHVKGPRSIKEAGLAVPKAVIKKNKAKREAAKAAEKKAKKK